MSSPFESFDAPNVAATLRAVEHALRDANPARGARELHRRHRNVEARLLDVHRHVVRGEAGERVHVVPRPTTRTSSALPPFTIAKTAPTAAASGTMAINVARMRPASTRAAFASTRGDGRAAGELHVSADIGKPIADGQFLDDERGIAGHVARSQSRPDGAKVARVAPRASASAPVL
jgi:hypothetical protein